jgi:hypothetical protein
MTIAMTKTFSCFATAFCIVLGASLPVAAQQGGAANAQGQSQQKPAKSGGKNLGNDDCDKKVRQKYPSGTLGNNQRLQFVLACREGKAW